MGRIVTYLLPSGEFSADPNDAHRVDPGDVVIAWRRQSWRIPATFAVGAADHEAGFAINERDDENGYNGSYAITDGIYQLDTGEKIKAGFPEANLFDLDGASAVFAALMERNYVRLLDASGLDEQTALERGILGYLGWSHNTGLGHKEGRINALESIEQSGLDWNAWVNRNSGSAWGRKMGAYGTHCITGGPEWRPEFDGPDGPYNVEPTVDASTQSKLRIGVAFAIAVGLLYRVV